MAIRTNLKEPICSVCIANYNGGNVLEECLESVYRQNILFPIEIIVHDDASTDRSVDIIEKKYPNVRIIRSNKNVGFCVSNNRMVAQAKGQYILLLNNDAELFDDAISTLYTFTVSESGSSIIGLPQYDAQTGELIDIGSTFDPFLNPVPYLNKICCNVGMVSGACMWFPKKLWDELGGFPEWFGSIAEDTYLCCLARLKGYPVINLAESGFKHWIGKSLGGGKIVQNKLQTTYHRRSLSERNKSYVMLLCYPEPRVWILMPLHLLLLIIEGVILTIIKKDPLIWTRVYHKSLKDLWNNRQMIFRLRRNIQTSRSISARSFYSVHSKIPHKLKMLLKYGLPKITRE